MTNLNARKCEEEIRKRLASLTLEPMQEVEIVAELSQHLEDRYTESLASGATPDEAYQAALAELSGSEFLVRGLRQVRRSATEKPIPLGTNRRIGMLGDLLQDLRYGLRLLRKSPAFTLVAVLSLALGIGANTAIFAVIDALMLRKLPVRSPEQLVMFSRVFPNGTKAPAFVYAYFEGLRGLTEVFSDAYAVCRQDRYNVAVNGVADGGEVRVSLVTGNYFSVLGVNAVAGRTFTADDDRVSGGHPVMVISDGYWERKFMRAPDIVGRTLTLNDTTYTVIGVTPRNFTGEWVGRPTDFWIPLAMLYQVMPELPPGKRGGGDGLRTGMNFRIIARLKPGVTMNQAQATGQVVFQQLMTEAAGPNLSPQQQQQIASLRLEVEPAATGYSLQRESFAQPLAILMIMVGLVLLIACANVANLLMARAASRRREMAVRLALGAGRMRIVRQLFAESMLLATMGGLLSLLFAVWGADVLTRLVPSSSVVNTSLSVDLSLRPDGRTLAFTTALCLLTGIIIGFVPSLRSAKVSLVSALAERGADANSSRSRFGIGKLLVIVQVALSLMLLIGAGLFVRTLRNLKAADVGFDREHVLLVWTNPGQTGRQTPEIASLWESVEEHISAMPGVLSASPSVNGLLTGRTGSGPPVKVEGYIPKPNEDLSAQREIVGPGFFGSVGQRLLFGRDFTARDSQKAPPVVVVNQSLSQHFYGNESPLGKHLTDHEGRTSEIVGVVTDAKYNSPRDQEQMMMYYYPYRQQVILHRLIRMCLAVRAAGHPTSIAASLRQELRHIDPNLPILRIDTVEEQLNDLLVQERLIATLAGFFGLLAVLLACLGLYGVISYSVTRRTNEIGIRLALGATPGDVLRLVLTESLTLVLAGVAIGIPLTLAATTLISSRLFGISAADPITIAVATLLMISVAAIAAALPARRASQVHPMVALRCE